MDHLRIENPFLDITVGLVGRVLGLVPVGLDLLRKALCVLLSALLGLLSASDQVVLQGLGVPRLVRVDDLVVPVVRDRLLEVLAVRGAGVGNAVIRQPSLKLRLVPLVVDCLRVLVPVREGDA